MGFHWHNTMQTSFPGLLFEPQEGNGNEVDAMQVRKESFTNC